MRPHEQRVVAELDELKTKWNALWQFIDHNPAFKGMEEQDRDLLVEQAGIMEQYMQILESRISRFK
ncbi:hypothetical protein VPT02_095 [Vibrio phage VPT02]|uniref:Uncharacterized protein n=1 Tax=Vibrio phage pVp-1 TaxID=1150989 RepID=H6WXE1_9CAUD|nr:hypothetical protein F404_gp050 [Vibrio phage pVp-1]AFB83907.1 hypothetical protein pVp-1_0050 [Vibrio phage pVp-1]QIG60671.1 hypothetical protein VPT02_095 [Vibrio phage VPT02]